MIATSGASGKVRASLCLSAVLAAVSISGCAARAAHERPGATVEPARGMVVTLYRDLAVIADRRRNTDASLTWRARYYLQILAFDGPEPGAGPATDARRPIGYLVGTLEITNHTTTRFDDVEIRIADRDYALASPADTADTVNRADTVNTANTADEPGVLVLAESVSLAPQQTTLVPLLPDGAGLLVPLDVRLLYDAIAPTFSHLAQTPIVRQDFGVHDVDIAHPEVRRAFVLDLGPTRRWRGLPEGAVTVFVDTPDSGAHYLGVGSSLLTASDAPDDPQRIVVLGPDQHVRVTRRQTDYAKDSYARRLIEEIHVDIENTDARDHTVIVHERLYRGSNWSIAYHNKVGAPRKVGPQIVRFEVPMAARSSTRIVYRVVYTWSAAKPDADASDSDADPPDPDDDVDILVDDDE